MKKPMIAPSRLSTIETLMHNPEISTQKSIIDTLYTQNALSLNEGVYIKSISSLRVRKLRIGMTERFCKNTPSCTTLL